MKITPFKVLDPELRDSYNVCISCSLFKMDRPYADFNKYINYTFRWIDKLPDNYFVRIYTDNISFVSEEFSKILNKNYPFVEIFLYDYPEFQTSQNLEGLKYHDGTFGSIMRFAIFFDIDLRENYNVDYFWVTDVDINNHHLDPVYINDLKRRKAQVGYASKACYLKPWIPDNLEYPIINYRVIIDKTVKISEKKFENFLENVILGKYVEIFEKVKDFNLKYSIRHRVDENVQKYFIYGFDELYTNTILIKEFSKYKTLVYYNVMLSDFQFLGLKIPNI
jgi:hypothetical protein